MLDCPASARAGQPRRTSANGTSEWGGRHPRDRPHAGAAPRRHRAVPPLVVDVSIIPVTAARRLRGQDDLAAALYWLDMDDEDLPNLPAGISAVLDGVAGTVGATVAGPFGAAAGVALTRAVGALAFDLMTQRQTLRVQTTLEVIAERISEFETEGRPIRGDGAFFDETQVDRAPATELAEAVLLAARESYEEKKLRLLGTLYASIAFEADVTPLHAHYLVGLASDLSYNQLLLLAALSPGYRDLLLDLSFNNRGAVPVTSDFLSVVGGLWELYRRNLVVPVARQGEHRGYWLDAFEMNPRNTECFGEGVVLACLMRLGECDKDDLVRLMAAINWTREADEG